MDVFEPGEHGSTWAGNALACAIANETLSIIRDENLVENSNHMGHILKYMLNNLESPLIREVRGKGLLIGIELTSDAPKADDLCEELLELGVICKGADDTVLRLSPPLTVKRKHIEQFVCTLSSVLKRKLY